MGKKKRGMGGGADSEGSSRKRGREREVRWVGKMECRSEGGEV